MGSVLRTPWNSCHSRRKPRTHTANVWVDVGYVIALGEGENIHITWLPIDVFEKTYKKCETFKDRMKIEIQELEERIEKAQAFYHRPDIADITDCEDRMLLAMQLSYMQGYLGTLKLRMKKIEIDW